MPKRKNAQKKSKNAKKKNKKYRFASLAPNGSKWLQKNPNGLKWLQMASNNPKWLELLEMATKKIKKNNQFKGFQVWLQMACHHLK